MAAEVGQVVKLGKLDGDLADTSKQYGRSFHSIGNLLTTPRTSEDETFKCEVYDITRMLDYFGPTTFTFNKALACGVSPFFEKAFRDGSDEAAKGVFKFDYTDPEVFRDVSSYIKRGQIFENNRRGKMGSWNHLCELWILAEKLQLPRVQNFVMEALASKANRTKLDNFTRTHALWRTYQDTNSGSPLRRMFRAIAIRKMQPTYFERNQHKMRFGDELREDIHSPLMERKQSKIRYPPVVARQYYVPIGTPRARAASSYQGTMNLHRRPRLE